MSNETTDPPDGQTPASGDLNGQTPTPQTPTPSGSQKTPIENLPADIQDYIARLREEAEAANKAKKAEARAKQQAEEARLKAQGDFEQLAEQHAARVRELEPIAADYAALATQVTAQIDAEVKDFPAEIKALDPGAEAAVETRMAWLTKARPLVAKLKEKPAPAPGNRAGPPPVGNPKDLSRDMAKTELLQSSLYKGF